MMNYKFNFGIDFSSGYKVQLKFEEPTSVLNIEKRFFDNNIEDDTVQLYGSSKDVLIKLKDEDIFKLKPFEDGTSLQTPPTQKMPALFFPYPISILLLPLIYPKLKLK